MSELSDYQECKRLGLCTLCKADTAPGKAQCQGCIDARNARRAAAAGAGMCTACFKVRAVDGLRCCQGCRDYWRARKQMAREVVRS